MVTAIFDGNCVICQSTRRIVKRLDWLNRVEFVDLHDRKAVSARYSDLPYEKMMGEIHVVDESGNLYAGYQGTRRILRELPLGYPLWLLTHIPGMNWPGNKVYRVVARNRYQINKLFGIELTDCANEICKMPE